MCFLYIYIFFYNQYTYILRPRYKLQLEDVIKQHVSIETTPRLPNEFDLMKPGVIKDIDREFEIPFISENPEWSKEHHFLNLRDIPKDWYRLI